MSSQAIGLSLVVAALFALPAHARNPFLPPSAAGSEPFAMLRSASPQASANSISGSPKAASPDVAGTAVPEAEASRGARFHANARVGITYVRFPVVVNRTDGITHDFQIDGAGGPGLAATMEVWPVFSEHFGIGAHAAGIAAATTGDAESAGATGYDLGGTAFVGPDRILSVVGRYSVGYRQAGVVEGFALGGFGGGKASVGSIATSTSRWGVGVRGCPMRTADDSRCAIQLEYLWLREGIDDAAERVSVHSVRFDWKGYFGVGAEFAPAWYVLEPGRAPVSNDAAPYFAFNIEYRNDFFSKPY